MPGKEGGLFLQENVQSLVFVFRFPMTGGPHLPMLPRTICVKCGNFLWPGFVPFARPFLCSIADEKVDRDLFGFLEVLEKTFAI